MGIANASDSEQVAGGKLVEALLQLNLDLEVPTPAQFGIDSDNWFASLDVMAQQALASGSPDNNPRIPQASEIVELYRRVWSG